MPGDRPSEIQWREWRDEAFEQAENEDKLILLDISAPWCHWCHTMDRTTYSNPEVIRMLNERFIPIRVDADRRPDIQGKYLLGGWPTTAFLLPDGRILTGTTYVPPEAMIQKLKEADTLYHEEKHVVEMHVTSMAAEAEADRMQTEAPGGKLDGEMMASLVNVLKEHYDPQHGGFGNEPKFPHPDAVRLAFLQYHRTRDPDMLSMALKTLDGMMGICDPVWGGFYRYAMDAAWQRPHHEKLLYVQAAVMDNYLEAYQVTGDDKYGEAAAGVEAYVTRFLTDRERGGFYGSQDADVGGRDPSVEPVPGDEYFPKDEEGRLAIGLPHVDKTVYTDWNGMMASAYFRLYHATGDEHARDSALRAIDRILAESVLDSHVCHYFDGQHQLVGVLSDQVHFAQALVDAYQSTGARKYLADAEKLAGFMVGYLQDVVDGGFYFEPYHPHAKGELSTRHKPFDENVAAARLLVQLNYLTGHRSYRELAERTLRAMAHPQISENVLGAGLGTALDLFVNPPARVVVVGGREDDRTRALLTTGLHAYEPGKLVQVLDPKEEPLTVGELTFEAKDEPAAYVCVGNVCRPPVTSADELAGMLGGVLRSQAA